MGYPGALRVLPYGRLGIPGLVRIRSRSTSFVTAVVGWCALAAQAPDQEEGHSPDEVEAAQAEAVRDPQERPYLLPGRGGA